MASNAGAVRAGRAYVELFGDDSKLVRVLDGASRKLKSWGASITALGAKIMAGGAAILGPMLAATKAFADAGDKLNKMAIRTGFTVEQLSALDFAAQQSGSSIDDVANAVLKMNRRLGRITEGQGSGQQVAALEALGLSAEKLQNMNAEERFLALADAMASYGDNAAAAGLAQRAFGTTVDRILPLLLEGREGIRRLTDEARELGIVLTTEDAQAAADLTDAWGRLTKSLKMAVIQIGAALAPALEEIADWMTKVGKPVIDWIKENRKLVVTIAAVAAGAVAAGGALIAFGTLVWSAGMVMGAFASALSLVSGLMAALVSTAGAILYKTGALASSLKWLGGAFRGLKDTATKALKGIADAIAAGDLKLAFQVACAGMKLTWAETLAWMETQWTYLAYGMAEVLTKAWYSALRTMQSAAVDLFPVDAGFLKMLGVPEEAAQSMSRALRAITPGVKVGLTGRLNEQERQHLKTLDEDREASLKRTAQAVEEARNEFAELADQARVLRERGTIYGEKPGGKKPPPMEEAAASSSAVLGTFNAMVVGRLGFGGGPAERTARATEGTFQLLRRRFQFTGPTTSSVFGP